MRSRLRKGYWITAVPLLASLAWAADSEFAASDDQEAITVVSAGDTVPSPPLPVGGSSADAVGSTVTTSTGTFQGNPADAAGIRSFKGMRYAAPPVGNLRWRSPQAFAAPAGIQPATAFGNACLSAPGPDPSPGDATVPQDEDCLSLNVWTGATSTKAAKPVMLWIHGGGFEYGSSARDTWDGSLMARRDVIVVSINYRLGIFGFLATPQFDQESGTSGDWGLQDQLAALRWVQQNIRQFGGDPKNVTVFGESAGAHAVGMLMTSPKAKGLFAKAIMESGATWDTEHGSISSHQEALVKGNRVLARLGSQDLRALPATTVRAAGEWDYLSDPTITAFTPSIDGETLTEAPMNVFAQRKAMNIPVLGGWNAAEWFPFPARVLPAAPSQLFYTAAGKLFGQACLSQFTTLYPATDASNAEASAMQLEGDLGIAEQTWEALNWQGRANRSYAYHFTYTSSYSPWAYHTAEVPFVFGTLTRQAVAPTATPSDADRHMADVMMSYWTNFAKRGDPNGPGLPNWPTIGSDGGTVMQLSDSLGAVRNPDLDRFRFIARYRAAGALPSSWRALGSPYLAQYQGPGCPD